MVVLILFLLLKNSGVCLYVSIVLIITKPDTNYFRANRVDSVLEDVVVESEIRLFFFFFFSEPIFVSLLCLCDNACSLRLLLLCSDLSVSLGN